ncbi:DUF421 domain-containing protein [Cohnella lupini]|uniref:Uncharacterized membrane protein YcaP (DUF421 family) n=1 Tax=Cohnella lupini TaxID=1294267 RepID=A0A3D9I3Q8_9BACL|nr:DUF421 domain-containing protein [Cohnella lupini]RED56275.1 uncharacterized membrane protein YcaP (DUF421 family) [Cohnella lupini]
MPVYIEVGIRTIIAIVLVIVIARLLGKQAISQMGYFDFAFVILLGTIAGNLSFNIKIHTGIFIASILTFTLCVFLLSLLALKFRSSRKWISGKPTIVIEKGKILEENLKRIYFTLDTLNQELRLKDCFNIEEVEYAVLELNGKLSILKKPEFQQLVKKDFSIATQPTSFPVELIMEGETVKANLKDNALNEWLDSELKKHGLAIPDIFYAVRSSNGNFYWDVYKDRIPNPVDEE